MNSRELSKIRLLKTKRKEKTTNPRLRNPSAKKTEKKNSRLRDAKVTRTRDFEIHQKLFRGFETGPKLKHFSAVFLMPVGEAELPTPNSMATFHLCQTGSDSEGLALLATAVITANCQQASLSCGMAGNTRTPWTRLASVFIDRHSNEGRWGDIHQRTLSLHGQ